MFDYKICRSCGAIIDLSGPDVCNDCLTEYNHIEKEIKESKYFSYLRYCKYCSRPFIAGKELTRTSRSGKKTLYFQPSRKVYCKGKNNDSIHFTQCQTCGGPVRDNCIKNGNEPNTSYCSKSCLDLMKKIKTENTCMSRYGVDHPWKSEEVKLKVEKTNFERYGAKSALCKDSAIRGQIDRKMREKYNVESNISQNPEIRDKINKTVIKNHGGYTWASEQLREKCKQTSIERYGTEHPTQSEVVQKKIKQTIKEKYGVDNLMQSDEVLQHMKENNLKKYGVEWSVQRPELIESRTKKIVQNYANSIKDPEKKQNYLDFRQDPIMYVKNHFVDKPNIRQLKDSLGGVDDSTIYEYLGQGNSCIYLSKEYFRMETDIQNLIFSFDPSIVIHAGKKKEIKPYQLDLYLPDYKIGIECNPTATHNSSLPYRLDETIPIMDKNYHKMKTDLCESQGIFLFHIFGYEWSYKREIIESMIRNLLSFSKYKFYARKLSITEISSKETREFLDANHRQGYANSSINLGLKTEGGELVALMTFGKMRSTLGLTKFDTSDTWELVRFCNKLNSNVVGGASKLFTHFLNNYRYDKIVSFSDRAHTRGNLYEMLGFQKINISEPGYVWVNYNTDLYLNRVTCQKQNLCRLFKDDSIDIKNKTEVQIMMEHGFVQVFDSGNIRWEYLR